MMLQGSLADGYLGVDSANRGLILADSRSEMVYLNSLGRVFAASWTAITPTGGTSVFAWLSNATSGNIRIFRVDLIIAGVDVIEVHTDISGITLAGGALGTIAQMNTNGAFNLSASTAYSNNGTVNFQAAAAMTGINAGSLVGVMANPVSKTPQVWVPECQLVLGPSKTMYLKTQTGGSATHGAIYFGVDP